MKRRILSVLIAAVMLISLLPAMVVSADADAITWPTVGETVTIGEAEYTYAGDASEGFSLSEIPETATAYKAGNGMILVSVEGDITLQDATVTATGVPAINIVLGTDAYANIQLVGTNRLNSDSYGILLGNDAYIYGIGSLEINVTAGEGSTDGYGIYSYGSMLDITDSKVTVNMTGFTYPVALKAYSLWLYGCDLTANVEAEYDVEYGGYNGNGIDCDDINLYWGASVHVNGRNCYSGLTFYEPSVIADSSTVVIELTGDAPASEEDYCSVYAVDGYGDLRVIDSVLKVTADGKDWNTAIWMSGMLDIKDGSAVIASATPVVKEGNEGSGGIYVDAYLDGASAVVIDDSFVYVDAVYALEAYAKRSIVLGWGMNILTPAKGGFQTTKYYYNDGEDYDEYWSLVDANGEIASKALISPYSFGDVKATAWYAPAINFVATRGIMSGVSAAKFNINGKATRAMVMAVLTRLDGGISDGSDWKQEAVEYAIQNGLSDGSNPDGNITREQVARMLWNYAGQPEAEADLTTFTDHAKIHDWAVEPMEWAVSEGILAGSNNALDPRGETTRAQLAQLLYMYLTK